MGFIVFPEGGDGFGFGWRAETRSRRLAERVGHRAWWYECGNDPSNALRPAKKRPLGPYPRRRCGGSDGDWLSIRRFDGDDDGTGHAGLPGLRVFRGADLSRRRKRRGNWSGAFPKRGSSGGRGWFGDPGAGVFPYFLFPGFGFHFERNEDLRVGAGEFRANATR